MVETTADPKTYNFVGRLEDVKTTTAEVVKTFPIDNEVKTTILLNVEDDIKTLLKKLSDKEEIGNGIDADPEQFKHLPNSITGVVIYYVVKGIREEFGFQFEKEPKSLKRRGLSKDLKKIAGKNDFSPETKRMNYWKKPK